MWKWIKRLLLILFLLIFLFFCYFGYIMYRAKVGMPFYETEKPEINIPTDRPSILLFSKTNGFVHGAAINAAIPKFKMIAEQNGWYIYETKKAGVFNADQLGQFDLTIWNNVSGNVLTDEQRTDFKSYIENGGGFLGVHAAGDGSHTWDWYRNSLIDAPFSHHPVRNHIQESTMVMEQTIDTSLWQGLPNNWQHHEEWYIFFENPRNNGSTILYTIDGTSIDPDGQLGPMQKDKTFGMGKDHPIVWYNSVGNGRALYSSMGHTAESFQNVNHLAILENAMKWTGRLE